MTNSYVNAFHKHPIADLLYKTPEQPEQKKNARALILIMKYFKMSKCAAGIIVNISSIRTSILR